jgi:hypothetical protein
MLCHIGPSWISGSNIDSLFSTNSSIIAPEAHQFILYLTEPIFFHRDVLRHICEKELHIFDPSSDVSFDLFNLLLKLCLQKGENH